MSDTGLFNPMNCVAVIDLPSTHLTTSTSEQPTFIGQVRHISLRLVRMSRSKTTRFVQGGALGAAIQLAC